MILCQVTLVFLFLCFLVVLTAGNQDDSTHFTGDVSINCGSKGNSVAHNGREWIGDVQPKLSTLLQLKGLSDSSTVIHKLTSADPVPYKTARISDSRFSYAFRVSPGQKIIRLHFNLSSYKGFKRFRDLFTLEAGPFTLLSNFSASLAAEALGVSSISKEFWKQCLNICIGAGRGLDYLHTGNGVIHRDVKASNILLDENLIAKVSDFGLAKPEDRSRLQTHVSTKVKGTFGYFDPYYFITSKLTRKSDTYAFGVVLLEVLCGRQATDHRFGEDEYSLTRWALNKINEGEIEQIVDSCLEGEIAPDSLKVFVAVAQRCLHGEPKKRPTMAQVVVQLELALEQQESRKLAVANDGSISSVSTEQSTEAFTDVQIVTSPPGRRGP